MRTVTSQRGLSAAGIRERVLREVKAFVGDAEPHDDETVATCDSEGHKIVADLGADRDERRRPGREPAFEEAEEERAERAEVPAQHVAVKCVHDDRRPA